MDTALRLRTGHCGLAKHLSRLGLRDTASCPCGAEEQTPAHILQTCPHLHDIRLQVWPADTSLSTKLWGLGDDLRSTVRFADAAGLKI